jgi:hypothetical protein
LTKADQHSDLNLTRRGIDMLFDKRKSSSDRRRPYKRLAKIKCYASSLPRDCMITEVTERDLKLTTEIDDIPAEFTIILSTGPRQCRLRWRNGHELGADFIDKVRRRRGRRRADSARKTVSVSVV